MRQPGTRKPTRRKQLGLTVEDYDRLLAAQGGGCAICGNPPKTRRLHVDHDHKTGRVRGLLCHRCNRALPNWVTAAWLYRARAYLERSAELTEAERRVLGGEGKRGCSLCEEAAARLGVPL